MEDLIEITKEANKCLNCKNPECQKGCPIQTDIPGFIKKIKENKLEDAYKILQENNIMSQICSNICPVETQCMGKCVRRIKGEPVKINKLEKFINEWAKENNIKHQINVNQNNNHKIAIVGSGPAGISCAIEHAKLGYSVTMFEKEDKLGGMLQYGIPEFRLEKQYIGEIKEKMLNLGIVVKNNMELGKDISINSLKKDGYSEIFLAIGAGISNTYKLSEKKCKSIYKADEFLKNYNTNNFEKDLGKVVVIGGGNVALDSARVALRMNASKVTIVYRRDKKSMPASKSEIDEALFENIEIIYNTKVIEAKVTNENLKSLKCIRTEQINQKLQDIKNSNFEIQADTIIFAIGLSIDEELLKNEGLDINEGLVQINDRYMTNIEGVFSGRRFNREKINCL